MLLSPDDCLAKFDLAISRHTKTLYAVADHGPFDTFESHWCL